MKKLVYLAAPYSLGDVTLNIRNVCLIADRLYWQGYIPFVPHLLFVWHLITPHPQETWLEIDREVLKRCDCVLRLSGESKGADEEVELAKSLGIPIYHSVIELLED